jgi:hypothetical protein
MRLAVAVIIIAALSHAPALAQAPVDPASCPSMTVPTRGTEGNHLATPVALHRPMGDYPPIARRHKVESTCISMFDVGEDGIPAGVAVRCAVFKEGRPVESGPDGTSLEPDYIDQFEKAATRLIACSRYAPQSDPSWEGKWRTNIVRYVDFPLPDSFGGGVPDPLPAFNRPGLPPMTAEQEAAAEELRLKNAAKLADERLRRAEAKAAAQAAHSSPKPSRSN